MPVIKYTIFSPVFLRVQEQRYRQTNQPPFLCGISTCSKGICSSSCDQWSFWASISGSPHCCSIMRNKEQQQVEPTFVTRLSQQTRFWEWLSSSPVANLSAGTWLVLPLTYLQWFEWRKQMPREPEKQGWLAKVTRETLYRLWMRPRPSAFIGYLLCSFLAPFPLQGSWECSKQERQALPSFFICQQVPKKPSESKGRVNGGPFLLAHAMNAKESPSLSSWSP